VYVGLLSAIHGQTPYCGNGSYRTVSKTNAYISNSQTTKNQMIKKDYFIDFRSEDVIPIVVHIVWSKPEENISDARVISQIEALNRDFNSQNKDISLLPSEFEPHASKLGIKFCLAANKPDGSVSSGIIRVKTTISEIGVKEELYYSDSGGSDAWDPSKYFNIWVANTGEYLTGFGTLPGMVDIERDGVVVNSKYFGSNNNSTRFNLGRVAVHETGHYLGLSHIWGDDEDCLTDDGIHDTPPQLSHYSGCPAYPQASCGYSNMFMNFMDYVDDECMVFFTQGQMEEMQFSLSTSRRGLKLSNTLCYKKMKTSDILEFKLFPNPTSNELTIDFDFPTSEINSISMLTIAGIEVFKYETVIYNRMKVNLPKLASGLYLIKIGNVMNKVVILI
jgi:hypothetical protein